MPPIRLSSFIPSSYHILCRPSQAPYAPLRCASDSHRVRRPTVDDVERLSRGLSTRHRGVGSRLVPHRVNAEERVIYERAQRFGYLEVYDNLGYRRERKGSPLVNIWRQWCDCHARPAVMIVKSINGGDVDKIVVDLSTLREQSFELIGAVDGSVQSLVQVFDGVMTTKGTLEKEVELNIHGILDAPIWKLPVIEVIYGFERRDQAKKAAKELVEFLGHRLGWKGMIEGKRTGKRKGRKREGLDD